MPSSKEIIFPQDAELPAMDIKQAFESRGRFTVFLGVPLWFAARANCLTPRQAADARAKIHYRSAETEVADENTGENVKTLLHRRVNARLLLENEDRSDLEVIPLLRVTRAAGGKGGPPRGAPR